MLYGLKLVDRHIPDLRTPMVSAAGMTSQREIHQRCFKKPKTEYSRSSMGAGPRNIGRRTRAKSIVKVSNLQYRLSISVKKPASMLAQ